MNVRIASWNVNSIGARLPTVLTVLDELKPDVICLQEIKCEDHRFPFLEIQSRDYFIEVLGQKSYNGVALLSKWPIHDICKGLPSLEEAPAQARYLEASISHPSKSLRVACLYAPNGNPTGSEKYPYKLEWLRRLETRARTLLDVEEPLILAGDYNVIPRHEDCFDPNAWTEDALFQPASRAAYQRLLHLGLTDAFLQADGRPHQYTFWDYQAGAWQRDRGIRIDHLLLSAEAADCLTGLSIMRSARSLDKPSDHVPICADFNFG